MSYTDERNEQSHSNGSVCVDKPVSPKKVKKNKPSDVVGNSSNKPRARGKPKPNLKIVSLVFDTVVKEGNKKSKDIIAKTPLFDAQYLIENRGERWTAMFNIGQSMTMISGKQYSKKDAIDLCSEHFKNLIGNCLTGY
jgi:hypothetical protein